MKILRPPPEFKTIKVECKNCTAELECEESDFERSVGGDQRDSWDHAITKCAACHTEIYVSGDKFPKHIYDRMKRGPTYPSSYYRD